MTRSLNAPLRPPKTPQHPILSRPELVLNRQCSFLDPKTGEQLTGTIMGTDTRPFAGGSDGVYIVIQLPPKKDPYAPGETLRLLYDKVSVLKP